MPNEEEKIESARKEGAMEQALKDISSDIKELKEEFRNKIYDLGVVISKIPCSEHRVTLQSLDEKVKTYGSQSLFVWGVLALFIFMTLATFSKANQAQEKIELLQKDINTLEKVSYGYNEFIRGGGTK